MAWSCASRTCRSSTHRISPSPLGDDRQSGLLFPSFGHSGNNGYQLDVPYYFNLAPNYDATLTPGYLSKRGVQLGGEFRFLTEGSHGQLEENFLPNDAIANSDRYFVHFTDITNIAPGSALRHRYRRGERQQLLLRLRGGRGPDQRYLSRAPRRVPVLRRYLAHPGPGTEFPDHRHLDRGRRSALLARTAGRRLRAFPLDRRTRIRRLERGHELHSRGGAGRGTGGRVARAALGPARAGLFLRADRRAITSPSTTCRTPRPATRARPAARSPARASTRVSSSTAMPVPTVSAS